MLLRTLLDEYLAMNTRIRSHATKDHYLRSIRQFEESLGGGVATVEDLTDDNLARFMLKTVDADGLSEVTANQRVKQLRALWTWAAKRRIVEQFPTVQNLREPQRLPTAWTMTQLHQLFEACKVVPGWVAQHRARTWWSALHWWLFDTGERITATLALERRWVDLEQGVAKVPAAARKGGCKAMVYRLRKETCELFAKMLAAESDTGLVFDSHWSGRSSLYKAYRRVVESADLPWEPRYCGFHKMRATVLTMIEAHGGNAQAFARHTTRAVTEAYLDQSIITACRQGVWPLEAVTPHQPRGWRKWLGITG